MRLVFILLIFFISLTGCTNFGSKQLPPDRISYNGALDRSEQQQTLLNIVRMRYSDPPYFLSINSIVSQFNFSGNYSISVNNQQPPPALIGNGNAAYSFSTSPTITYTPLQGEDYVRKMLAPIDISVIGIFLRAGWSPSRVLRIFVQRFGAIPNAVTAGRPVASTEPVYEEFSDITWVLLHDHHLDNLIIKGGSINGSTAIRVEIRKYNLLKAKERKILKKLGVTQKIPYFWIVTTPPNPLEAPAEGYENQIVIETRTVLGVWSLLSKGVDVTPSEVIRHVVPMTKSKNGLYFDWRLVTKGLFRVYVSCSYPANAFVAVRYHNLWFYILDSDQNTKETLEMLMVVTSIYQGQMPNYLPVFTVS